jgi:hypothetical protein
MDLDVAARMVAPVEFIEIEPTGLAAGTVYLYRHRPVLAASLIRDVLDYPFSSFAVWYHVFDVPVDNVVYF